MTDQPPALPRVTPLPAPDGAYAAVRTRHRRRRRAQGGLAALTAVALATSAGLAVAGSTPDRDSLSVASPSVAPSPSATGATVDEVVAREPVLGGSGPCAPATLSTVRVGLVAHLSGVLGEMHTPAQDAAATFAAAMNACNGLNGHRVEVLVRDDQTDPATARTVTRRLIAEGVLAFLGGANPVTLDVTVPLVAEAGLPTIGGDLLTDATLDEELVFPQGSSAAAQVGAALDAATGPVGAVTCTEIPLACEPVRAALRAQGGARLVSDQARSVTAPDYRSTCRELEASGARTVVLALDPASVARLTASCVEVGYRPTYALLSFASAYVPQLLNRIDHDGLADALVPTPTFPWASTATPATRWFQQQQARFGEVAPGSLGSLTWTAGALLVAASGHLDPQSPTADQLLGGLRELRGQAASDLRGLSASRLDLSSGAGPRSRDCAFVLRMDAAGRSFDEAPARATCR